MAVSSTDVGEKEQNRQEWSFFPACQERSLLYLLIQLQMSLLMTNTIHVCTEVRWAFTATWVKTHVESTQKIHISSRQSHCLHPTHSRAETTLLPQPHGEHLWCGAEELKLHTGLCHSAWKNSKNQRKWSMCEFMQSHLNIATTPCSRMTR